MEVLLHLPNSSLMHLWSPSPRQVLSVPLFPWMPYLPGGCPGSLGEAWAGFALRGAARRQELPDPREPTFHTNCTPFGDFVLWLHLSREVKLTQGLEEDVRNFLTQWLSPLQGSKAGFVFPWTHITDLREPQGRAHRSLCGGCREAP